MAIIFLDMDGVFCSFVDHALKTHGREEVKITHWNIEEQLGLTTEQFQKPINKAGASWWRSSPELQHWKDIWRLANKMFDEVFFLSSPLGYQGAETGKKKWLQDRLGKDFDRHIFTTHKHVCAKPNSVLVDDSDKNCEAFIKAGGHAVCFPQPWSSTKEHTHDPIPYLERQLEDALKKIRSYEDWQAAFDVSEIEEGSAFDEQ